MSDSESGRGMNDMSYYMKKMSKRGRRFERRLAERRKRAASKAAFAEVARILAEAMNKDLLDERDIIKALKDECDLEITMQG